MSKVSVELSDDQFSFLAGMLEDELKRFLKNRKYWHRKSGVDDTPLISLLALLQRLNDGTHKETISIHISGHYLSELRIIDCNLNSAVLKDEFLNRK